VKLPAFDLSALKLPRSMSELFAGAVAAASWRFSGYPLFLPVLSLPVRLLDVFRTHGSKIVLLAELEAQRQNSPNSQRVEIQSLGPYWFSGVSLKGPHRSSRRGRGTTEGPATSKLTFDQAHVRVSILPLLVGRVTMNFGAKAVRRFRSTAGPA